jgi:MEMO1 family protein
MKSNVVMIHQSIFFCFTLTTGLFFMATSNVFAGQNPRVRQPAVAGQFYPDNPTELKRDIESYLSKGKRLAEAPTMLISPHAGYVFSGPVAAKGFATIDKKVNTVFIIGPAHHYWLEGVSILDVDSFATPLGNVPLNLDIVKKLRQNSIVHSVPAADAQEHSVEVQIPFLQVVLPSFSIVPIVMGKTVDPESVAALILPFLTPTTLVIASSDLSHFLTNAEAHSMDNHTIHSILSGTIADTIEACGNSPIRVVMYLAKKLSLSPHLLDARTSFDTAAMDSNRVVGYASIVYLKHAAPAGK